MPANYDFPTHYKGDTMEAITFTITVNGLALDFTGASAKMDVRKDGILQKRYTNGDGLTFVAPVTGGVLRFDEKIVDFPADTYDYDIQFALASGDVKTYIIGTIPITQDITHD